MRTIIFTTKMGQVIVLRDEQSRELPLISHLVTLDIKGKVYKIEMIQIRFNNHDGKQCLIFVTEIGGQVVPISSYINNLI